MVHNVSKFLIVTILLVGSCFGAPTSQTGDNSRLKGCLSRVVVGKKSDCESLAQMCFVTKEALIKNNPTVLNETVCNSDSPLPARCKWVCCDYENDHADRTVQGFIPIVVPDVLGIGSGLGSSLLGGILDRGTGSGSCSMNNVNNLSAGFASIGFIGSANACQTRCFFTLGCNFWSWRKTSNLCVLATDFRRASSANSVSGPKTCSVRLP